MNLSLIDHCQGDFPEVVEEYLEYGITKCIAFNRRGTLLAAGCQDGSCVIWDFDTRGVAKQLKSGEGDKAGSAISSVSWSKCGFKLLAASLGCQLVLWDVATSAREFAVQFETVVLHARMKPGSTHQCLACPMSSPPLLVDLRTGEKHPLPTTVPAKDPDPGGSALPNLARKGGESQLSVAPVAATFNKGGDLVYVGTLRGEVLVVEVDSRQMLKTVSIPGGACIKQIMLNRTGQYLLTNSNDRVLRVFRNLLPPSGAARAANVPSASACVTSPLDNAGNGARGEGGRFLEPLKEFQDAVNRTQWKSVCFNGDGEYVAGAAAVKGEHKVNIWASQGGALVRFLEGPKEGVVDLAWHPFRPILATVATSGYVYLWAKDYAENWSAFAPDFKELEENEEYVEKEDEFDQMPEEDRVKPADVDEDEEVDVEAVEKVAAFSDSDDSDAGLHFLPTVPEPDQPPEDLSGPAEDQAEGLLANGDLSPQRRNEAQETEVRYQDVTHANGAMPEDPNGEYGVTKRKRKQTEKAAELQAEKSKSLKKGVKDKEDKGSTRSPAGGIVRQEIKRGSAQGSARKWKPAHADVEWEGAYDADKKEDSLPKPSRRIPRSSEPHDPT